MVKNKRNKKSSFFLFLSLFLNFLLATYVPIKVISASFVKTKTKKKS